MTKVNINKLQKNGIKATATCTVVRIISDLVRDNKLLPGGIIVRLKKTLLEVDGYYGFFEKNKELMIETSFIQEEESMFKVGQEAIVVYKTMHREAMTGTYLIANTKT